MPSQQLRQYPKFEDWFYEIEAFSTRAERFYSLLEHYNIGYNKGLIENLKLWLDAAYQVGIEEGKRSV